MAFAAGKDDVSLDTASLDKDVTSVYGTDCEKVKPGEARSTVRVRVTDKASYLAVSSLPDLRNAKVELNEHDFNVMVYNLVDNNIEDMAIRTTKQTPEEICVEVTGYISGKNIFAAIDEALDRQKNGGDLDAEDVFRETWLWLKERGCENLVSTQLVRNYAMSVSRWIQCEHAISEYGFLAKHPTTGQAIASPYVSMSQNYMKQVNNLWYQIFQIVKENCSADFSGATPQDDVMEKLLRSRRGN